MSDMDCVYLSDSGMVIDGLRDMMESAVGSNEYIQVYVNVEVALLIIEAAKRAEDKPEWFPRGQWATIQSIQRATEEQLAKMFQEHTV